MKPRITFQEGNRVIIANSREFHELPPINQELELNGNRYKIASHLEAVIEVVQVPWPIPAQAPARSTKAKHTAKKQAKAERKEARAAKTKAPVKAEPAKSDHKFSFSNKKGH